MATKNFFYLFSSSVCGPGHQYRCAAGHEPRLDVLLLLRGHVHVLLCPLANLCLRYPALWHVSVNTGGLKGLVVG